MLDFDMRFQPGQTVVFEGDSNTSRRGGPSQSTWPYLRLMRWEGSWADRMAELLFCWRPDLALRFANNAVGGSSCEAISKRIDTVLLLKADWVLITTGGNDVRLAIDPEEFMDVWRSYCTRLHQACGARVVFLTVWGEAVDSPPKMRSEKIEPYRERLDALADELPGVRHFDLGPALSEASAALKAQWSDHTVFSGPDGHYNAVGDLVIAGEVLRRFGIVV